VCHLGVCFCNVFLVCVFQMFGSNGGQRIGRIDLLLVEKWNTRVCDDAEDEARRYQAEDY
jgi:hypothetical protein